MCSGSRGRRPFVLLAKFRAGDGAVATISVDVKHADHDDMHVERGYTTCRAGCRECIYGTSMARLFKSGRAKFRSQAKESWLIVGRSETAVRVLDSIGTEFIDPLFE
jgi:hypothetical protein